MKSKVKSSIMDAIGQTPIIRLGRLFGDSQVLAKLEYMNPGGSIKDRMVRYMLKSAPAGTQHVVESSSGNTGAALSMASAVLGLKCDITLPGTTSIEKIKRVEAYGARVHLCASNDAQHPEQNYQAVAERIMHESGAFHLNQYCSELNRLAHYHDTGPELWSQLDGEIDVFVCGIGSGGTISGIARFLKEKKPGIMVIGVEPANSAYRESVINEPASGSYETIIEGVGKATPSRSFDPSVVDDVVQVCDKDALDFCHRLAREEGILAGGSSGCVTAGIAQILPKLTGKRVVTIFPDSGAFYLSKYF